MHHRTNRAKCGVLSRILWILSLVVVAVFGVVSAAGAADSDFINPINVGSLPYVVNDTIGAGDTARFYRDVGGSPQTISGKTYAVQLTAGTPYVFRLESTDDYFDPYLYLNSSSDLVTYNDDDGVELNSRIIYTPTVSGTYYVIATTYEARLSGQTAYPGIYTRQSTTRRPGQSVERSAIPMTRRILTHGSICTSGRKMRMGIGFTVG